MKKLLLVCLGVTFFSVAQAQTLPSQRVYYGEHQADIDVKHLTDTEAEIEISNPQGAERVKINSQYNPDTGAIHHVATDETTGKVVSRISGQKDEYLDVVQDYPTGEKLEMHLTDLNEKELSGRIKASGMGNQIDVQMVKGKPIGTITQVENGVETKINMMADGSMSATYSDAKTKKLLYTVTQKGDIGYVYDASGKLIASGNEKTEVTVYDQAAYDHFTQISESDDDDE